MKIICPQTPLTESLNITLLNVSIVFQLSSTANGTTVKPRALKPQVAVKKRQQGPRFAMQQEGQEELVTKSSVDQTVSLRFSL